MWNKRMEDVVAAAPNSPHDGTTVENDVFGAPAMAAAAVKPKSEPKAKKEKAPPKPKKEKPPPKAKSPPKGKAAAPEPASAPADNSPFDAWGGGETNTEDDLDLSNPFG